MKKIFVFLFAYLMPYWVLAQVNKTIVTVEYPNSIVPIGRQIYYLEDSLDQFDIKKVQEESQAHFQLSSSEVINFGNNLSTFWFRISIDHSRFPQTYLEIDNAMLDDVSFFYEQEGIFIEKKTGANRLVSEREIKANSILFSLPTVTNDSAKVQTYYLRIKSQYPLEIPISVGQLHALMERQNSKDIMFSLYMGIMISMALYNLFVFLLVRDRVYLIYSISTLITGFCYLHLKGYIYFWFLGNYPILNDYTPSYAALFTFFMLMFANRFLETARYTPNFYKFSYAFYGLFVICIIISLSGNFLLSANISQLGGLIVAVYVFVMALRAWIAGNPFAKFYLIAWSTYIISMVIFILHVLNVIVTNSFTSNAVFVGTALEVLLLSFALAYRINLLKKEKDYAQSENLRLIKEQNEVLEMKIKERTEAINQSNEELRQNLEELQITQEKLRVEFSATTYRSELIKATAMATEYLLKESDLLDACAKSFEILGNALQVEQVYIFERWDDEQGEMIGNQLLHWSIYTTPNLIYHDPNWQNIPFANFATLTETVLQGKPYIAHIDEMSEADNRAIFELENIKTLLVFPLFINNEFKGLLGFDACVEKREWIDEEKNIIGAFTTTVAAAMERNQQDKVIKRKNTQLETNLVEISKLRQKTEEAHEQTKNLLQNIQDSINYALRIQNAIIPKEEDLQKHIDCFVFFRPRDVVSGDFYFYAKKGNCKILAVADCTGHGVSGAFMTMIGNNILNQIVNDYGITAPNEILNKLPVFLGKVLAHSQIGDGMDISIIRITPPLDPLPTGTRGGVVTYTGAMNPLYYVHNQKFTEIKADKMPISAKESESFQYQKHEILSDQGQVMSNSQGFTHHSALNTPHLTLYLCSDGYQDQFGGAENKKFMVKKLKKLLFEISEIPMPEQKQILEQTFEDWKGDQKQTDDVLVIGIRV